jgi:hypothetical protein
LQVQELEQQATIIRPFDEIIQKDFCAGDAKQIAQFLDNRPRGSVKEDYDGVPMEDGPPDLTLLLHTNRFRRLMRGCVDRAVAEDGINAPFKSNWKPTET